MDKTLFYSQLCEQENELIATVEQISAKLIQAQQTLDALRLLKKMYSVSVETKPVRGQQGLFENLPLHSNLKQKRTYVRKSPRQSAKITVKGKVLKALQTLGTGNLRSVTDKLLELFPDYNPERAYLDAKYYLSRLNSAGLILSEKSTSSKGFLFTYKEPKKG